MRVFLIVVLFVFFAGGLCYGQPDPPGGGGNPTPISGIEWLLLAGGVLGGKKIIQGLKSKKVDD
jgi:hypothetical protein